MWNIGDVRTMQNEIAPFRLKLSGPVRPTHARLVDQGQQNERSEAASGAVDWRPGYKPNRIPIAFHSESTVFVSKW